MARRKLKLKPKPKATKSTAEMLARMGDLIKAGYGTKEDAHTYFTLFFGDALLRLQSIAARAEKERNWEFMHGSYKQAAELFVLASVVYEKYPEHSMLSDGAFDHLGRFLLENYDRADTEFWNWYNITSIDLKAGTGMAVTAQTPIRWMVYLLTGEELPDEQKTVRERPGVLRKTLKRRRGASKGGIGSSGRRVKQPSNSGDEPDKSNKAEKSSGRSVTKPRPTGGKPKKGAVRSTKKPRAVAGTRRRRNVQ